MITNIIALYPGRFQPFGKHHAASFKWLESEFGGANCYIVTTNITSLPKSPFSFKDKQDIISQYELNDRLVQVKNPYKSEEILSKLNPKDTAVVFMVGQKDMNTDPRFKIGKKVNGKDSYFQDYKKNKSNLKGFNEHGYLIVAPHISIKIPGFGEMSGTTLRKALGAKKPRSQKIEQFKAVFGWYNKKTANMIFDKLESVNESKISTTLFSKQWWGNSLELNESISIDELKSKFKSFIVNIKQENTETKEAFVLLTKAATGKIVLSDAQKMQIGEQMKDVLKSIGLTALAIVPGGIIAALIIKLLKAEKYVTPSSFIKEVKLPINAWKNFNLSGLSNEDIDIIWNMYSLTYKKAGMDFSANDAKELQTKYKAVYLEDVDGDSIADAFIIFKPTQFGNKIALLGTNDKSSAKKELIAQLFKLLKTQGWFIEASLKIEDILSANTSIPVVTDETIIQSLVGHKGLEMMEDGYYKRKLSKVDKSIVKRLYGNPNFTSIKEVKKDPCWSGYRQYGMKKKGNKKVPNCVAEHIEEGSMSTNQQKTHNKKINKLKSFLNSNIGREFEYDFDQFSKTVFGVKMPTQESVKCEICNSSFRQITERHLKYKHNITLNEYVTKYPNSKLLAESLRKELRDNNPMKDKKNIEKIAKTKLLKYGNSHYNNIQKQQNTIQEKYGVSNISKLPHNIERAKKQLDDIRERAYASGRWLSAEDKIGYIGYRDRVRNMTNQNFKKYRELYKSVLRSREWHLDHKYSIFEGYKNNISESIIAHPCNLDLIHHAINESKNIKSSITLNELMYKIEIFDFKELLMCGGAGGHMHHVFNIEWVKTGKDLIKAFQMSINYLKKGPAAVKIDGVNASIRLITIDNKKQFVMDRGSNKPLDVKGITKAELTDRFGDGHGMIVIGGKVLDIFNESIPDITDDLKKLGLWDNPNIMFNIEYVSGSSNVLSYNKNFLAIHGLLEIAQISPTKRATKEKSYNKAAMQKLLNNLAASAGNYGYEVLGSIPTVLDGTPNLTAELNKKYTITFNVDTKEEKSLSQWLATAKVPTGNIKTIDGKSIAALSKEVLIKISDGIPLSEYIADTKDYQAAADGFAIYMATMKLGDAILEKLNSPLGPVSEHEGIVIRDTTISNKPFKITGSFIIKGMQSSFRK